MRTALIAITAALSLGYLLAAGTACAETKARKPSVCADFRVLRTADSQAVGACFDGKRPKVFTTWTFVEVTDPDTGAKRRFAVGF